MNASTVDPGSVVEQSASLRRETEDMMNQTKAEFQKKQDEHAKALDNLADQLETLDLSELSEKVKSSLCLIPLKMCKICVLHSVL